LIKHKALSIIFLMGIVSLFADITYEGARGIIPTYLTIILGAPVAVLGIVTGLGDSVGYAFRLVSGKLADVTRRYWFFTFVGYFTNLLAIPLLAFATNWQWAALIIVVERLGKAIRTPSRDLIISVVAKDMGKGKAFGLHEALDQVGAIAGPLIASAILFTYSLYRPAFLFFSLPAVAALATLFMAYRFYGKQEISPRSPGEVRFADLGKVYWIYLASITLSTAGFMHIAFILYRSYGVFPDWFIPIVFLLAQVADAFSGILFGFLYDKHGLRIILFGFPIAALIPVVAFQAAPTTLIVAALLFGVVLGMQETIQKAAVADIINVERRGTAYGVFNATFGLAWLIGGATIGMLYEMDFRLIIAYSILLQAGAAVLMSKLFWKYPKSAK